MELDEENVVAGALYQVGDSAIGRCKTSLIWPDLHCVRIATQKGRCCAEPRPTAVPANTMGCRVGEKAGMKRENDDVPITEAPARSRSAAQRTTKTLVIPANEEGEKGRGDEEKKSG